MPRLSVVLVVHREQAWIHECVRSILEQSYRDFELIVIDDASPDHGPQLLDDLASADDRIRLLHLSTALPRGAARNIALDRADGDYLWFVQTTDRIPEDAFARVAARLDETDPDVLLVDHVTTSPLGVTQPSSYHGVIAKAAAAGGFRVVDRPAVADVGGFAGNLVLRRRHVLMLGVRFGEGGFDELSVTYPALLAADRVSALEGPAYHRRIIGNADTDPAVHGRPSDVIAQYRVVFSVIDAYGGRARAARGTLPSRMVRQGLEILETLPADEQRPFFHELASEWSRQAKGKSARPHGRRELLLHQALRTRSFAAYRAMAAATDNPRAIAVAAAHAVGVKRPRRAGGTPGVARQDDLRDTARLAKYYAKQRELPLEPDLAVFAAYWYRGYSCSPRAIYEKARELVPWLRGVWIVTAEGAGSMPDGVDYVVAGTEEYYRLLARATYLVNNVNFPNNWVKREGQVHVQTHHGIPVKLMGMDLLNSPGEAYRTMKFPSLLKRIAKWDYSLTRTAFDTLCWEHAYPMPYTTLEIGLPRDDALVHAKPEDCQRIRDSLGIAPGQRVILYAPTHREYDREMRAPADIASLAASLGPDDVLLVRSHYFADRDPANRIEPGTAVDVSSYPSIEELYLAADVFVTDYSSAMFDYALLDRPIVIFAPDWETYRTLRGTYFDLFAEPPGVVTTTQPDLVEALLSGAADAPAATSARAAFRARFCQNADGHASERCIRAVFPNLEATTITTTVAVEEIPA
ncbi:MAG TPA: bifunctional glycosyltransferase family 2 protein/CDP-glycerol:glycerophosphate glycerophosphotransferase [Mycobacteriales bacterium]|nr:bifunctional glycosyltransferase family 2 protein/CDP-glycerol:glycerophosphate glycerophosphotransferase [Mycobacteriales bacterium]